MRCADQCEPSPKRVVDDGVDRDIVVQVDIQAADILLDEIAGIGRARLSVAHRRCDAQPLH